ncbi:MAG: hypothetical protein WD648_07960 [Planctomycetaceae bacterium]
MQQVKLFKSVEAEISILENDVNAWIRTSRAKVLSVHGNIAPQSGRPESAALTKYPPSDVLIVILYDDGK